MRLFSHIAKFKYIFHQTETSIQGDERGRTSGQREIEPFRDHHFLGQGWELQEKIS